MDEFVLKVPDKAGKSPGKTSVQVDYSGFEHAYGGDYGSRLRLVQLPECALTTPDKAECKKRTPVESRNDIKNKKLTATNVAPSSGAMVLAAEPAAGGAGGETVGDRGGRRRNCQGWCDQQCGEQSVHQILPTPAPAGTIVGTDEAGSAV